MALEVEAKFRVESHEMVRQRLRALNATYVGRVLETNGIYDRSRGTLRQRGYGLRIRSAVDEATGRRRSTLTLKGPVRTGAFKSREEWEIEIDDAETARRILTELGYVRVLEYEKRRESWRLDDCLIELDEPPCIGLFVEIEGPTETSVLAVQRKLGWEHAGHLRDSYVAMLDDYCREKGLGARSLRLQPAPDPTTRTARFKSAD